MKIERSLVLHFRYKQAEYKVTDDTGNTIKDYQTLLVTGSRIKAEHDKNFSEHDKDSLVFSYQIEDGLVCYIRDDVSLKAALHKIRRALEELNQVIKIDISDSEERFERGIVAYNKKKNFSSSPNCIGENDKRNEVRNAISQENATDIHDQSSKRFNSVSSQNKSNSHNVTEKSGSSKFSSGLRSNFAEPQLDVIMDTDEESYSQSMSSLQVQSKARSFSSEISQPPSSARSKSKSKFEEIVRRASNNQAEILRQEPSSPSWGQAEGKGDRDNHGMAQVQDSEANMAKRGPLKVSSGPYKPHPDKRVGSQKSLSVYGQRREDSNQAGGVNQSHESNKSPSSGRDIISVPNASQPDFNSNPSFNNGTLSYSILEMKYPPNSEFQKGGKLHQVLTLQNDGEVVWPGDTSLFLTKKQKGVTVLDEILVGEVESLCKKQIVVEIFAFSCCEDIEILEFELRHNRGTHTIGHPLKMQFKMIQGQVSRSLSDSSKRLNKAVHQQEESHSNNYPSEERKEEHLIENPEQEPDDYELIAQKEDSNALIDRLSKIQHVEQQKQLNQNRQVLQEKDRERQMEHLLVLRRNNLVKVSNEINSGIETYENLVNRQNQIKKQKNQLRYFIQMQENDLQQQIQMLQDELKSVHAVGEMQLGDKDLQLRQVEKRQHEQKKKVKSKLQQHRECLNTLLGDYREYCMWNGNQEDSEFLDQLLTQTPQTDWTYFFADNATIPMSYSHCDPATDAIIYDQELNKLKAQSYDQIQQKELQRLKLQRQLQMSQMPTNPAAQSFVDSVRSEAFEAHQIPVADPKPNQSVISQGIFRTKKPPGVQSDNMGSKSQQQQQHLLNQQLSQMKMHFQRLNQNSSREFSPESSSPVAARGKHQNDEI